MGFPPRRLWPSVFALSLAARVAGTQLAPEQACTPQNTLVRHVCILGGGSSGTYAALRLHDRGRSVVVVEQGGQLGGHAETRYFADGRFINYGVEGVFDDELSRGYLHRLGVAFEPLLPAAAHTDHVDFKTGQRATVNSSSAEALGSLLDYRRAVAKYGFLGRGLYDLPDPVPEELLRPFGDFVRANRVEAALPLIFTFASAAGLMLQSPLLEVLQLFGAPHVDAVLAGYITPVRGMHELYRRAAAVLGPDNVVFGATAARVDRSAPDAVTVVVRGPGRGGRTCIRARKLLVAMPPTLDNMEPVDLDAAERGLFEQWQWKNYYVAVVNNSGIPDGRSVANVDAAAPYMLPTPPFQWQLEYMGVPGYVTSKLVADAGLSPREAKDLVLADLGRLSGAYPVRQPDIVDFASHAPSAMRASLGHIRDGFYKRLYALQGRRNTFYTGRAFCSDYSSLLWAYTDTVVDQMVGPGGGD